MESALLGERKAVQILQRPEADKGCTVALPGVVEAVAVVETAPVGHVAVAVAVVVAVAAVAIENFASPHIHSLHTRQTVQVEGAVVRALALAEVPTATADCTPAALGADLQPQP